MSFTWREASGKTRADPLSRLSAGRSTGLKNSLSLKFLVSVSGLPGMTLNELPCAWNRKTWKSSGLLLAESHLFEVAFCLAVIVLSKTPRETGFLLNKVLQEMESQTHSLALSWHFREVENSGQSKVFVLKYFCFLFFFFFPYSVCFMADALFPGFILEQILWLSCKYWSGIKRVEFLMEMCSRP